MSTGGCRHGCRFHIYGASAIGFGQFGFLYGVCDCHEGHKRPLAAFELRAASIPRIDHDGWRENITHVEILIESTGEANRVQAGRTVQRYHCFGGAAGGFEADAATDRDPVVALEENELTTPILAMSASPVFDQSGDLAVQSGYQGDVADG